MRGEGSGSAKLRVELRAMRSEKDEAREGEELQKRRTWWAEEEEEERREGGGLIEEDIV